MVPKEKKREREREMSMLSDLDQLTLLSDEGEERCLTFWYHIFCPAEVVCLGCIGLLALYLELVYLHLFGLFFNLLEVLCDYF